MGLHTRLTDLPVTGGSHVSHAILLDRCRTIKNFWARARIVRGGENRVLRRYLSRSRTCSFFIAVLTGGYPRLVRIYPSRSDANRSKR